MRDPTVKRMRIAFMTVGFGYACALQVHAAAVSLPPGPPQFTRLLSTYRDAAEINVAILRGVQGALCVPAFEGDENRDDDMSPLFLVNASTELPALQELARPIRFRRVHFESGIAGMSELGAPNHSRVATKTSDRSHVVPRGSYKVCLYFQSRRCDGLLMREVRVTCSEPFTLESDSEFWLESVRVQ